VAEIILERVKEAAEGKREDGKTGKREDESQRGGV
jgi:hypothetical protein